MAVDPRRFDQIERVVRDTRRGLDDTTSTLLARLGALRLTRVVTATSEVTTPYTGQTILNTTDLMLYRYTGSAWEAFLALGGTTSATRHEARYEMTSNVTVANITDTKMQFHTAVTTSDDVTPSLTNNQNFTLNRAGVWRVSAAMAWLAATGYRYLSLQTGSTIDVTKRFTQNAIYSTGARSLACACSTDIRVAANTVICAIGWQDSGGSTTTDAFWGGVSHLSLTWLRP
jgi:hypothetical protein